MKTQQKTLLILRHAKAVATTDAAGDHARPLADRGVADATSMGNAFATSISAPQQVLCSTAERTRDTHAALALDAPVIFSEKLYLASGADLVMLLRELPETTQSALIIGHNPGVHELVAALTFDAKHERDIERLREGYPTCALSILTYKGSWNKLSPDSCMLEQFLIPSDIT